MRTGSHTAGQARARLGRIQRVVAEKTEMQKQLARLDDKRKALKLRIKELDAALALESIDVKGESVITAGESRADVVGKIGGDRAQ